MASKVVKMNRLMPDTKFSERDVSVFAAVVEGVVSGSLGMVMAKQGDKEVPYLVYVDQNGTGSIGANVRPIGPLYGKLGDGFSLPQEGSEDEIVMAKVKSIPGDDLDTAIRASMEPKKPTNYDIN